MENIIEWPDTTCLEEEAAAWIVMLDGEEKFSEHNKIALREWLSRSPEHVDMLNKLNAFWADNSLTELLEPSLASVAVKSRVQWPFISAWRPMAALSMVLMLGLALIFGEGLLGGSRTASNGLYATAVGEQKSIELADGSIVELNTNSQMKVEYSEGFRNIHLIQGEMHFNVAKDPVSPFRVYARNSRVQAVGTAFTVYLAEQDVQVYVTEGRVALAGLQALAPTATGPSIPAKPSQLGGANKTLNVDTYVASKVQELGTLDLGRGARLKTSDAVSTLNSGALLERIASPENDDLAKRLAWRDGLLVFSGETLEQVVAEVSRYTTVHIELSSPEIRDIEIAGQVHVGDTESMFKALESNFGLKVNRLSYNLVEVTVK
ncbi:FecR domain-containing protein [Porticoccaceae bacterium]|nr:FecR domain-containing protein [Porticoccaceae bacterium]